MKIRGPHTENEDHTQRFSNFKKPRQKTRTVRLLQGLDPPSSHSPTVRRLQAQNKKLRTYLIFLSSSNQVSRYNFLGFICSLCSPV